MFKIIVTILLVGAFFILFFKPKYNLKTKQFQSLKLRRLLDL